MRRDIGFIIGGLGVALLLICGARAGDSGPVDQLHRRVTKLEIKDQTLEEALRQLQEAARVNILPDGRALERAEVDLAAKRRLDVYDLDVGRALDVILAVYAGDRGASLGYREVDGIIRVSTGDALRQAPFVVTRAYDVRDFTERFIQPLVSIEGHEGYFIEASTSEATTRAAVHEVFGNGTTGVNDRVLSRQQVADKLVNSIEQIVDRDSWRDMGGQTGAIREIDGLLIVEQLPENQRRVQNLLQNLRDLRAAIDRHAPPTTRPIDLLAEPGGAALEGKR